jgi:hypothetical protein
VNKDLKTLVFKGFGHILWISGEPNLFFHAQGFAPLELRIRAAFFEKIGIAARPTECYISLARE